MLYDYQCNKCPTEFEVKRPMTDESPVPCPACQSTDTTRLITGVPHIAIAWKNVIGLGHSGQKALPSVLNKARNEIGRRGAKAGQRIKHLKLEEA